ncbi:MAG: TSUP family transporter [Actinomycetia bacterium]|nr:TSUP family transporter [Actinomycetes bacterium]MCP3912407.1 TSUP family transporter [Actinomycetes bacterium]MCP4085055.1 TSUP family transporter [Actinomycetes bacterium]
MSSLEIVLVILSGFAGAVVQGSTGVGLTLMAGPLLVAIDSDFVPGPLLVGGLVVGVGILIDEHALVDRHDLRVALTGLPVGLLAGLGFLALLSQSALAVILGGAVVLSGGAGLLGLRPRAGRASTWAGGVLSAFGAVSVALPGPPFVICYQPRDPQAFRPTIAAFVTLTVTFAGIALLAAGEFGRDEAVLLGWLLPGLLVGTALSARFRPILDRGFVRPAVLTLSVISGALLVISEVL